MYVCICIYAYILIFNYIVVYVSYAKRRFDSKLTSVNFSFISAFSSLDKVFVNLFNVAILFLLLVVVLVGVVLVGVAFS